MRDTITALAGRLAECASFEQAGEDVLGAALRVADAAVAASRFAARGRVLRGMVHIRPPDGYRRLLMVEQDEATHAPAPSASSKLGSAYLPSATAWRAVVEHRCAVAIDVTLGTLKPHAEGASLLVESKGTPGPWGFSSQESQLRLLGRAATHVYALPLRGPNRSVDGMITIEADCRGAIGDDFVWPACGPELQLVADLASPYVTRLPQHDAAPVAPDEFLPVVGPSMAALVEMLRVFAQQEENILLSGPTGAGKSRLARWCHEQSPRRGGPFESLDLSAVPEELQLGELYGWRKGAFTGAVRDNPGSIQRAERGTLFIDEIDKLSMKSQAGLLHVLEERSYRVLGEGAGDRNADVRFVVGTNADLPAAVRAGRFREDLFYRINVLPVRVPPLGERRDEVAPWAGFMAGRRHRERGGSGEVRITAAATHLLSASSWPGNLRQLDNIVRRAYALALLAPADGAGDVVLDSPHVERALGYEGNATESRELLELLLSAARAFAQEAERRSEAGTPLDLDHADAFRGFVLGTLVGRVGKDDAFRLLGKEALVASRNHHKALRREIERVTALCQALGISGRLPFPADVDDGG